MPRIENLGDLEIVNIPHPGNSLTCFRISLDKPLSSTGVGWAFFKVNSDGSCYIERDHSSFFGGESAEVPPTQNWLDRVRCCEKLLEAVPSEILKCAQVLACYSASLAVSVESETDPNFIFIKYGAKELIRKPAKFTTELAARLGRVLRSTKLA